MGIVVVPALPSGACGAITWWRLQGPLNLSALSAQWLSAGLPFEALPDYPTPQLALKRAVRSLATRKGERVVTLPKQAGFAVTVESFETAADDTKLPDPVTHTRCKIWLDEDEPRVRFISGEIDSGFVQRLEEAFHSALDTIDSHDVSAWLVSVADKLDAVRLRDTGGIYFLPATKLKHSTHTKAQAWAQVQGILDTIGYSCIYHVPALHTEQAAHAVLDALRQQTADELRRIEAELDGGDLGSRAIASRTSACSKQLDLLTSYEDLLDSSLTDVREAIEQTQARLVEAAIQAAS